MDKKNKISCSCGLCELFLNDPSPKYSVMCACEDCRQALRWAEINGGAKPKDEQQASAQILFKLSANFQL